MRKLHHPLWTHLPAMAILAAVLYDIYRHWPLPQRAPIHFNIHGQPDNFGNPVIVVWVVTAVIFGTVILSAVLDEIWARQESRKRFNWISLFDELTAGFVGGILFDYLHQLKNAAPRLMPFGWPMFIMTGLALVAAVVLELRRPFRPADQSLPREEPGALENMNTLADELRRDLATGRSVSYSENQNPLYLDFLSLGLGIWLLGVGFVVWRDSCWIALAVMAAAVLCLVCFGGIRVKVTREMVVVRLGYLGFPLARIRPEEITTVEVHHFSPLADFGGWGIRFNRQMKGFFFRGTFGVKITRRQGKAILIGSDHPERLARVIQVISLDERSV